MWAVWLVTGLAVVLFAIPTLLLWPDMRRAPRGWQLLAASGLPLALGGLGFIVRFWEPTPGPYLANQLYPYGTHLNAWAVSFGFMWLAFGIVFFACALRSAPQLKRDSLGRRSEIQIRVMDAPTREVARDDLA